MGRSRQVTKAERLALERSAETHQLRSQVLERRINTILKPFKKKLEKAQRLRDELARSLKQHQDNVAQVAKACGVDVPIETVRPFYKKGTRKLIRFEWDDGAPARDATPERVGRELARKPKPKKTEVPKVDRPLDDKPAAPAPAAEPAKDAPAPVAEPKAEEKK